MSIMLANPERLVLSVMADAIRPAPPVNLEQWAVENITFGKESQFPGPYDPDRFPFFTRLLEVLSFEHPARTVVLKKSAQLGGTIIGQVFVLGTMALDPRFMMVTHPNDGNVRKWRRLKLKPMLRRTDKLKNLFPTDASRDGGDSAEILERRDGAGAIIFSGANSSAQLSSHSVSAQVQDDLSKWQPNDQGDPETQADSRSIAFADAKIFKVSTPTQAHNCKISKSYKHSTKEQFHVPCPQCQFRHPLEFENMLPSLDRDHPENAHFTCPSCGFPILQHHRAEMVRQGVWTADNPGSPNVGLYIWSAYSPLTTWARISEAYFNSRGNPDAEQTFLNDWIGQAYETAGDAPEWEVLRDRAERPESGLVRGRIPVGGLMLIAGADCQGDRVEVHIKAFGGNLQRWTVDYRVIPGHISTAAAREALDALLQETWPDSFGNHRTLDMLAIDAGAYTNDVKDWVKSAPRDRVMAVKGAKSDDAPDVAKAAPEEITVAGRKVKRDRGLWLVGGARIKTSLYKQLRKDDPQERGYCGYPSGMGDEFWKQLCNERRVEERDKKRGFSVWRWHKVEKAVGNEVLDTEVYAEAAAVRLKWKAHTDVYWQVLAATLEVAPPTAGQGDLFDPERPMVTVMAVADVAANAVRTPASAPTPATATAAVKTKVSRLA
ncbi:phage terminase large subunit family protein [Nitrospirillum sp. BR 11163]|uniref:phage terminase large subunit family protein n=1 Tax=Nitrospirillum sp. BR 11163 TaxID=3104323 RepID=UPI002AFFE4CD|nr:terminase gpA endonuclease subunit [Nitrospirillum sp. BR 11163]MEA1674088.1 terminase gpA endonuclease subunit [Nitrospirillum sp. BR 11163]